MTKENIKKDYTCACNNYLDKLLENWGLRDNPGWWVGDEIGGVYCCEDDIFINMNDIVYCVDNDVDWYTYTKYLDYTSRCCEFGFDNINLKSFVKGAPRISDENFERLYKIKQELNDSINEIKEKN